MLRKVQERLRKLGKVKRKLDISQLSYIRKVTRVMTLRV